MSYNQTDQEEEKSGNGEEDEEESEKEHCAFTSRKIVSDCEDSDSEDASRPESLIVPQNQFDPDTVAQLEILQEKWMELIKVNKQNLRDKMRLMADKCRLENELEDAQRIIKEEAEKQSDLCVEISRLQESLKLMRNAGSIALEDQIAIGKSPKDRSGLGYNGTASMSEKSSLITKIAFVKSSEESVKEDHQFTPGSSSRDAAPDRSTKKNSRNRKPFSFRSSVNHNHALNTDNSYSKSQAQSYGANNRTSRRFQSFRRLSDQNKSRDTGVDRSQARNQRNSTKWRFAHYQCYHCHKWGHIQRFCRLSRNQKVHQHDDTRRPIPQIREWRMKTPQGVAFSCHKVLPNQQLLDRGCVFHSSGEKKIWSIMKKINGGQVNFGEGTCNKVLGKGMMNEDGGRLEELRAELSSCNPE